MSVFRQRHWLALAALAAGCGAEAGLPGGPNGKADDQGRDQSVDMLATTLIVDVEKNEGQAILTVAPDGEVISLDVARLEVLEVFNDDGELEHEVADGRLTIKAPSADPFEVVIDYRFAVQTEFNGLLENGSTVTWPYHCGNLFPCQSHPGDGLSFELSLEGIPADQTAIFPEQIAGDSPSYTLAWAVGDYECQELGASGAGTSVEVCWLPRGKTKALSGTRDLVRFFDWFENNLGPYTFGDSVASVSVKWGGGAAGGMEHHPFWHVADTEMNDPLVHAHEAAHGWFGTGVRIGCWEDFVLSEGTVSYLTARVIGAVNGKEAEDAVWDGYKEELELTLEDEDILAWPRSCGEVDILEDGLFSNIVYMKGAFFYRAIGEAIGVAELDAVLSSFYKARVGKTARMQDMLDHILAETGFDAGALASHWLRSRGNPFDR